MLGRPGPFPGMCPLKDIFDNVLFTVLPNNFNKPRKIVHEGVNGVNNNLSVKSSLPSVKYYVHRRSRQ